MKPWPIIISFGLLVAGNDEANIDNIKTEWLPNIERVTVRNGIIDINLHQIGVREDCYLGSPDGTILKFSEISSEKHEGITAHPTSEFVSCRATIGPIITNDMLGNWTLVGAYEKDGVTYIRKQATLIEWPDEDNRYSQVSNNTYLDPNDKLVHIGNTIRTNVTGHRSSDILYGCYLKRPDGQQLKLYQGLDFPGVIVEDTESICLIAIGPIERDLLGEWKLIGKFNENGLFYEQIQSFRIILEDPTNPMEDPSRTIIYLNHELKTTKVGSHHQFIISRDSFTVVHSCHIRTPNGLQYQFMQNFDVTGVEIIEADNNRVSCGVDISILSEDQIGNWTLIARETATNGEIERRFPFTLYVEEWVSTLPDKQAIVAEQNDFYIRLEYPTDHHATCELLSPESVPRVKEYDERYVDTCGFIIRNVTSNDSGTWEIRYGKKITYRSQVELKVQELPKPDIQDIILIKGRSVNITIGPYNAVYCKLDDPSGITVFNEFSPCRLDIENVLNQHEGLWRLYVSLPGHMVSVKHFLRIIVRNSEQQHIIKTEVTMDPLPAVILSCSVFSPSEPKACKFRDPSGRILIASQGLGEDRYTFHGSGVRYKFNKYHMDCGIKISKPSFEDLGIWRCAIDSANETYFGFLSVICPWLMEEPEVADKIISDPKLTASQVNIRVLEGDSSLIFCRISSAIAYCYFRSQNGTVINISPDTKAENLEYIGQGFGAGECGLRIHRTNTVDEGRWSCNVGLDNSTFEEQSHDINVEVQKRFIYDQYLLDDSSLVIGGVAHDSLQYCRFIRSDGLAFTTSNPPSGYFPFGTIETGYCGMTVSSPSQVDYGSWTIVLKTVGQHQEFAVTTNPIISDCNSGLPMYALFLLYVFLGLLGLIIVSVIFLNCVPKKRRISVFERARIIRNSLTRSFQKQPLPVDNSVAVVDIVRPQAYSAASA